MSTGRGGESGRRALAGIGGRLLSGARRRLGNPFSQAYYMGLGYILVIALGLHMLVALRFAPEAGITLSRLLPAGGPGLYVAALDVVAVLVLAKSFLDGYRLYPDRRLAFTFSLYQASTTLPYVNLLYIGLSSLEPGPAGLAVRPSRLAVAIVYLAASIIIAGLASGAPFSIVEIYRAKKSGAFTLVDVPSGGTLIYGEGEVFRLVYTGRRDREPPMLVFVNQSAWEVKQKAGEGRLEALFRPLALVEDTLTLSARGKPLYRIRLRPARMPEYGKPDTEIHLELVVPTEGGKTIRKIIVQRPGGVSLSRVLRDVLPSDLHIQRILRIEGGKYIPVRDPEKERIKPKTLNRFVIETLPAAKPPKPAKPGGLKAGAPSPVEERAPAPIRVAGSELVEKVKRLIEEYSELREDLW